MNAYNFALFEILQTTTTQVAMRAGELAFQLVNEVLTAEDLVQMVDNARKADNGPELAALVLVTMSVQRLHERAPSGGN